MRDGDLALRPGAGMPEKIRREHRDRLAIVYIRQSTMQQVERHQESTRLQYALTERAYSLGRALGSDDRRTCGLSASRRRGRSWPCRAGARRRDVASGALMPGLAPIARD